MKRMNLSGAVFAASMCILAGPALAQSTAPDMKGKWVTPA